MMSDFTKMKCSVLLYTLWIKKKKFPENSRTKTHNQDKAHTGTGFWA